MKANLKFTALGFGLIIASAAVGNARADMFTVVTPVGTYTASNTQPWTSYNYTSPKLSVAAGVQFGNHQNTVVNQNSDVNVASVAQVGNHLNTLVVQQGQQDLSNIAQIGHNNSALVLQFGQ